MAATNIYTINGEAASAITAGFADIDMSTETGVKAGCTEFPIPLLNKITVTSTEAGLSKSTTIYAGYKIVEQMLGTLVPIGNYNPNTPLLNRIIFGGRFGIFEPAHYNSDTETWVVYDLSSSKINSLMNIGTGIKICVKIEYTKSDSSLATVYVPIPRASDRFDKRLATNTPYYSEIGGSNLSIPETVGRSLITNAPQRPRFESVLTRDILDVNLGSSIVNPDTTQDMTVTLMAYIGSIPTADNTFPILPMASGYHTSVTVQFQNYDPVINIYNKDTTNNQDNYSDGYGSVAEYAAETQNDTIISISIVAPE